MIRRDDGNDWLLISQVAHAQLAGDIAAEWSELADFPLRDELLFAVRHHDDGWSEWESAPTIDPETGFPRDFTEMPMDVATEIWSRSITICEDYSPWAGVWVSRHFCYLAERAKENREDRPDESELLQCFLETQAELQSQWMDAAKLPDSAIDREFLAETGYLYVQFFDRISLWICCAERTRPLEIVSPGKQKLRCEFTPHADGPIAVAPTSTLSSSVIRLQAPARRIGRGRFEGDSQLQQAVSVACAEELVWSLQN